jgi:hypothetical protein
MGGLRRRIAALERKLAKGPEQSARPGPADEAALGWLATFEAMGQEGTFDCEPDFPKALAYYREAIRDATAPAYYRHEGRPRPVPEPYRGRSFVRVDAAGHIIPDGVDVNQGVLRRVTCAADEGWDWLTAMALRVTRGVAPVTEAEFLELTDWLGNVLRATDPATFSAGPLEVGTACGAGDGTTPCDLWRAMREQGPRGSEAGEQAEAARRLKGRYVLAALPAQ